MTVIVTKALRAQEPIIQNLVQLYTHDFSELWGGNGEGGSLARRPVRRLSDGGILDAP
jgi:hypothetical protein